MTVRMIEFITTVLGPIALTLLPLSGIGLTPHSSPLTGGAIYPFSVLRIITVNGSV